ncbi:MAG TPA: hypothetical protein VM008_16850 [Phycisphaerae bacterium]|nr:hypothetical protein [Phycisphaerae bacterium]
MKLLFTQTAPIALVLSATLLGSSPLARADSSDYQLSLSPHWSDSASPNAETPPLQQNESDAAQSVILFDAATTAPAPDAKTTPPSDKLQLTFELPLWFSGLNGTVGVRGFTAPANACFSQILQNTDSVIGLGGRIEADYKRWIFYGSGFYMKLTKDDVSIRRASVNFIAELAIADAGILYQVGQWSLPGKGDGTYPMLTLDAGAAARYMHVRMELNTKRGLSRETNEDWVDPLFAGQVALDLDKHWQFLTRGDVGGGVDAYLTWSVGMFIVYQFKFCPTVSGIAKVGYECMSEDYANGEGNQKFTWNEILHGPLISFAVEF